MALILALAGATLLALAAGLIYLPAGIAVAGVELIAAAYVARYLEAHREAPRRAR